MSSHREAPEISKDPAADNTDVYAFISPDKPDTVTLIANFVPLQSPQGGPNFYEFGDDVLYEIKINNSGGAKADVVYQFRFTTTIRNPNTFLYNTGPIAKFADATFNRPQTYSVTKVSKGISKILANGLSVPPCNVGIRSTPNYKALGDEGIHSLGSAGQVFAGQRAEAFFVDLGSIFDLGTLRPFQHLHLIPSADAVGVNSTQGLNVHSIALQVPLSEVMPSGWKKGKWSDAGMVIGVWSTASRQKVRVVGIKPGWNAGFGPFAQVSRLGNPLFNEVIVPMAEKDKWNAYDPSGDSKYAKYVAQPELAKLLPVLYPKAFPMLKAYTKDRADLLAILLTGIPAGVVPNFQNYTGATQADMLRLNVTIPATAVGKENPIGLVAGDAAGFPNGRRLLDDIVAIELKAVAGATIPLVDKGYTPDGAAGLLNDGTKNTNSPLLKSFPYMGYPGGGYQEVPGTMNSGVK